ncbi:MAG: hypothetical protein RR576_05385 [Oscillospiraceae bacterium]
MAFAHAFGAGACLKCDVRFTDGNGVRDGGLIGLGQQGNGRSICGIVVQI